MTEAQPTPPPGADDQSAPGGALPEPRPAETPHAPESGAPATPTESEGQSQLKVFGMVIAGMIGVVLVATLVGIIIALADPDAAPKIGAVRDIFIIVLAWFSILIALSLLILVLQMAALVNLLKNEVIPILESLQRTADTVRGTAQFMGKNLAQPVIRAQGLFATIRRLLELLHLMSPQAEPLNGYEPDDDSAWE